MPDGSKCTGVGISVGWSFCMLNSTAKRRVHGGQVRDCCYSSSHQFHADGCKLANDIDVDSSGRKWTHASVTMTLFFANGYRGDPAV